MEGSASPVSLLQTSTTYLMWECIDEASGIFAPSRSLEKCEFILDQSILWAPNEIDGVERSGADPSARIAGRAADSGLGI